MNEYLCLNITPGHMGDGCVLKPVPDTLSSWELVHSLIGFQLFEEIPPYSLWLGCVKLFTAED